MALFKYTATKDGESYSGTATVADRFELYAHIQKEGGTITAYSEEGDGGGRDFVDRAFRKIMGHVKEADKVVLTRNLGAMLSAGLSLSRALTVMGKQTKNKSLKDVLSGVREAVEKGGAFHEALGAYPKIFTPLMIAMVKAGEESGKLAESLAVISEQLDRAYTLKKKVRGALIYPCIVVSALIAVGVLMLIFIVPTLTKTFNELHAELPASTRFIIALSEFLTTHTLLAAIMFVVGAIAFIYALRTKAGKRTFNWILLRFPVIGTLVKETNSARTARTLSSLLSSGVEIVRAISITKEVLQNSFYKDVLAVAEERIQKGAPLADVFTANEFLYPPLVAELIAVGEETGKLPGMLLEVATFYEREVEQKTKDMSTIIEPFLMLIVGCGVGFFAVSMITPIYSIGNSF
jgi:type IV pilus assembly protein PilC